MSPFENFLLLCWSTSLIAMYLFRRFNKSSKPLPPGPWSLPWIGNIKCLFSRPNWISYTEWYRTYESDIVHVNIAGNSVIILNTSEAAMELLERRSSIYSSRWEWSFISMPYGQKWNAQRKLVVNMFNANNPEHHEPQELKSTRLFLLKLYEKPEDFVHLLRKMGGSTILSVIYGYDVDAVQDSAHTENAEQGADGFLQTFMPGSFLVDYIPWMRYIPSWFPGASFQCRAQVWKEAMEQLLHGPFDEMRNSVSITSLQSCFVSRCMGKLSGDSNIDQEWVIKQTAGSIYLAGTDTTLVTLLSFFLAMTKYPEFQKKAQEELDRVVGAKRLPDFDDRDSLPYIQAIVYEVMRQVKSSTQGSIVIANVWAMLHEEKTYTDPYIFNPDRYIRIADGQLDHDVVKPLAGFGFGRRVCPGKHMAFSAIWIAVASILSVFNISKALDADGDIIEPSMEYDTSTLLK
ncbi:cytochrome P450 [Lentinula aff. lateritia]|uniref:Cytochrome P450 n=1 Tax=Lentinula aff. lateritia TaxID=2804960 RepID=A0ACC1TUM2_9AGAR|nr:cytochrome P450 [Lentinula aff. lateritia]